MPDFTRLLAIGLLNYADDHGYFWANPLMIRGALFPFDEDSSKVRRALAQLASEGYLRIGKSADGREAGHIINFSKHQRVDRAVDSEIQPLVTFDESSTSPRRVLDDDSSLDRKGREGIGKEGKGGAEAPAALPQSLDTPEFRKTWENFRTHRQQIRKKLTPMAEQMALKEMAAMGSARAIIAVEHTIGKGWQGIREPDHAPNIAGGNRHQLPVSTAEDHRNNMWGEKEL